MKFIVTICSTYFTHNCCIIFQCLSQNPFIFCSFNSFPLFTIIVISFQFSQPPHSPQLTLPLYLSPLPSSKWLTMASLNNFVDNPSNSLEVITSFSFLFILLRQSPMINPPPPRRGSLDPSEQHAKFLRDQVEGKVTFSRSVS